jgi:hypothetical protein
VLPGSEGASNLGERAAGEGHGAGSSANKAGGVEHQDEKQPSDAGARGNPVVAFPFYPDLGVLALDQAAVSNSFLMPGDFFLLCVS